MVSKADVELMYSDSEIFLRSKRLLIGNKRIETPIRALSLTSNKICEAKRIRNYTIRGIKEIFRNITKSKLVDMIQHYSHQKRFISKIRNDIAKSTLNPEINMVFFKFDNRTKDEKINKVKQVDIPPSEEIEYLCDLLFAPFNDIIVPPIMPFISGEKYLKFLRMFFDFLPSYRTIPVMGLIPGDLHRFEYPSIIDFYEKNGIRLFVMDIHGGTPESHYADINLIQRMLSDIEKRSAESCYLQGLNVKYGKPLSKTIAAPAKDIASFYMGFDCFGPSHVALRLPPDLYERLEWRPPRLFNRNDYGYYQPYPNVLGSFPREKNVVYNLHDLSLGTPRDITQRSKIFNAERQGIEADILRLRLEEGKDSKNYLVSKRIIPDQLIKKILRIPKRIKQKKLF